MLMIYWLSTYGDGGLETTIFLNRRTYERCVRRAEKEHESGGLDSYTHCEEIIHLLPRWKGKK